MRRCKGRTCPCRGDREFKDHQGRRDHPANDRQRIGVVRGSCGRPLQKECPRSVKASRTDPRQLQPRVRDHRERTTANKATEAALTAYPGGLVDRVMKLSKGECEVHNIGVNWPHHIFVTQAFKVVGAE